MEYKSVITRVIKIYGLLAFVGLLLPYIVGSLLVATGIIGSTGVFEFSLDAFATRYFAGFVSLMLASAVYLGGRYAIALLVIYTVSVPLISYSAVQNPTRNITQFDVIITWILVTIFVALPFVLIVIVLQLAESSKESDNVESRIVSFPTGKKIMISVVVMSLLFSSVFLVASNYESYDEYSGGEIGCSNHDNIRYMQLGVIPFSSLNEIDKKIFRMTINHSYLVSIRDDLNKTKEYQLMVTKDSGNDEIIIYEGEERDGERRAFIPPDRLLDEPKIDITGSEYFFEELRENQPIQYQGELYRCHIDEFHGYPGA